MDIRLASPLFSLHHQPHELVSARQSVLAENVANADTPNYIARDHAPDGIFEHGAKQPAFPKCHTEACGHASSHIAQRPGLQSGKGRGRGRYAGGKVVAVEQEMIKLSDTQLQYQTATNLYQKAVNMFRTALGRRSG